MAKSDRVHVEISADTSGLVGDSGALVTTFVDGIGPPLEQLWEDYSEDITEARDLRALMAEVWRLRAIESAAVELLHDHEPPGFGRRHELTRALQRKAPCLFPLPDGGRCCECSTCHPQLVSWKVER